MTAITRSLSSFTSSSIGRKTIVAITGLGLVLFLLGHLSGNLLIFAGPDAFNEYAEFLHGMLHGVGIWIARIGLLAMIALHVIFTIKLTQENRNARPKYAYEDTLQASKSSRIMILSGLTILAFVIFHILHYTVRTDAELAHLGATNPWKMVVVGFQNPLVSGFYVLSMALLCSHLSHGVASIFQTLGISSEKTRPVFAKISFVFAWGIFLGFISIPVSILAGLVK